MTLAIAGNKDPTMSYGSKFRPVKDLGDLLGHHAYWCHLKHNMSESIKYPMSSLPEEERVAKLEAVLERGNHRLAHDPENKAILLKLTEEDAK
eukprot:1045920-Ditylum_brightwellii.AAC.1